MKGSEKRSKNIEIEEFKIIKTFLSNLIFPLKDQKVENYPEPEQWQNFARHDEQPFERQQNKLCLLKLLTVLLDLLNPENLEAQIKDAANVRLDILQRIMEDCGVLEIAFNLVDIRQHKAIVD